MFWAAASWTSTPNAGIYGALNPGQWGTLIESNSFQIVPILHDVAVDALHVTDGVIRVGTRVQVNVTVHNFGDEPETTSLMLYANNTTVEAQILKNLPPETVREISFTWYAGGSGPGLYVLKAVANQVRGETDLSDNYQTITVTVRPGASSGTSGAGTGVFDLFRNLFLSIYFPIIAVVILGGITIALRHRFSLKTSTSSP